MGSLQPIDKYMKFPKQIEQIKHWLDLLGLEYVILSDSHDGSFTFLLPIKNCPDINITLEKDFSHISFFSNGLTRLSNESKDTINSFLRGVMKVQGHYFTGRVISTGSSEDLRVFLGFRFDEMSMYRFSRKIRELIQFVKEISMLIEKNKMNELWRDTEQEPKFPEIDIRERIRFL
ncbi:MAG: hypothetical protein JSW11_15710 [Candidatus Heimdallarchaeota archaeon]|nr:MAG: hypothetical protein JSW11_15710 [Candidatus Heimdallarchaeota archaeon]